MNSWPTVDLEGKQFVIPRVCPNCMAPGDKPWSTTHINAGVGRSTRYTMTFYYCDACDHLLATKKAIERKQLSYGPKLLGLWIVVLFGCLMGLGIGVGPEESGLISTLIGWVVALASIGGGVHFTRRMAARRRALMDEGLPPLPPNALGHDFAAYLIDMAGGVFSQKTATFTAARQEWLDLLVDANPATGR